MRVIRLDWGPAQESSRHNVISIRLQTSGESNTDLGPFTPIRCEKVPSLVQLPAVTIEANWDADCTEHSSMTFADLGLTRYWNVSIGAPANAQVP